MKSTLFLRLVEETIPEAHQTARSKGFWDDPRNTGELYMLIVSELGEAIDAHRKGKSCNNMAIAAHYETWEEYYLEEIKDTWQDEIAGTALRIMDYLGSKDPNSYKRLLKADYQSFCKGENFGEDLLQVVCNITSAYQIGGAAEDRWLISALLDLYEISVSFGMDLEDHIKMALRYNATRPYKNGSKY